MNPSANPLAKHFRQPGIYLTLPSKGAYWPDGSIDLNMNGQVAVYPMTTRDEITIRTPDALLNGESVVQIIQSCCPQIKNAWKMPSIDVDATLIAIRIASYGTEMDIDTVCSHCNHENKHALDLSGVLDGIASPNYSIPVSFNGLKIKLKPQSYFEANKINLTTFEEQRLMSIVNDDKLSDEDKMKQYQEHMSRIIDINISIIAAGTDFIETEDGTQVTNTVWIKEFYDNADTKVIKAVREKFDSYAKTVELPKPKVKCEECEKEYPVAIQFDYANFFDNAS